MSLSPLQRAARISDTADLVKAIAEAIEAAVSVEREACAWIAEQQQCALIEARLGEHATVAGVVKELIRARSG